MEHWWVDAEVLQGNGGGLADDIPQFVAEKQAQDEGDADAADGKQQALAEFLEMLEETHAGHALFFFVTVLVGRIGRFGRGTGPSGCDGARRRRFDYCADGCGMLACRHA